jgi:quinol monooxygenase YgiN
MSEQISWCVALGVKPGQLDNFMKLTQEMVASTRNEPGVLSYQRFVGDDNKIVHAQERYVDSGAALMHLQNFAEEFAERFVSMVDRTVARKAVSVSRSCSVERADSMDPAPLGGKRFGGRQSDAAARTGNERDLAAQFMSGAIIVPPAIAIPCCRPETIV